MSKKQIFVLIAEINKATAKQDVTTIQTLLSDVKELLKADRSIVNEKNESQHTPIIIATAIMNKNSNVELVKLLIDAGADVKATTRSGQTPLILASQNGHDKVVELLLCAGADANAVNDRGISALFIAAEQGHDKVVELLLGAGADAKTVNNRGISALFMPAKSGHDKVVELLLKAGADAKSISASGISALHMAAEQGHDKVVELLLGAGADAKTVNNRGISALYMASQKGYDKVVKLLLGAKAEGADLKLTSLDPIASGNEIVEGQYSNWNDEDKTKILSSTVSANNSNVQISPSLQELVTQQQIRDENNQDDVNSIGTTTNYSTFND